MFKNGAWWGGVIFSIALGVFAFCLILFALAADPRRSSELWKFDWQAVGAFATFFATGAALYIAGSERRNRERDRRNAMKSFAIVGVFEVHVTRVAIARIRRKLRRNIDANYVDCHKAAASVIEDLKRITLPFLGPAVAQVQLLDEEDARKVAEFIGRALHFCDVTKARKRPQSDRWIKATFESAHALQRCANAAYPTLCRAAGIRDSHTDDQRFKISDDEQSLIRQLRNERLRRGE